MFDIINAKTAEIVSGPFQTQAGALEIATRLDELKNATLHMVVPRPETWYPAYYRNRYAAYAA